MKNCAGSLGPTLGGGLMGVSCVPLPLGLLLQRQRQDPHLHLHRQLQGESPPLLQPLHQPLRKEQRAAGHHRAASLLTHQNVALATLVHSGRRSTFTITVKQL